MQIFIAHVARDRELASQVTSQLLEAGFTVGNAPQEIEPGINWAKEIGRALDESDLMVAIITREALKSEFFRQDIQYGLASKKFEHRLIPVLVGYTTFVAGEDVPWILLKMDPVYTDQSRGFAEVVDRVREIARQETNATC